MPKEVRWTVDGDYTGMRQMCDTANSWLRRAWTYAPAIEDFIHYQKLVERDDYYI